MHHADSRIRKQFQYVVTIGHAVGLLRVADVKPSQPANCSRSISPGRSTPTRAATQRTHVQTFGVSCQAAFIARQHFDIRETPVGESHRLRALQISISRHYRVCGPCAVSASALWQLAVSDSSSLTVSLCTTVSGPSPPDRYGCVRCAAFTSSTLSMTYLPQLWISSRIALQDFAADSREPLPAARSALLPTVVAHRQSVRYRDQCFGRATEPTISCSARR